MTVQREIERARAIAEAARGNYLLFSEQTEDKEAQQVYLEMAEDMERHVGILQSRLEYLQSQDADRKGAGKKKEESGQQDDKI